VPPPPAYYLVHLYVWLDQDELDALRLLLLVDCELELELDEDISDHEELESSDTLDWLLLDVLMLE